MRMQLGNHLRHRQAQDASQIAVTRAEISNRLFEEERKRTQSLSAEVMSSDVFDKSATCLWQDGLFHSEGLNLLMLLVQLNTLHVH